VVALFAVNIIIATMFLRWHYVIDVVAGLCLAVAALNVSCRVTRWEELRRAAARMAPSWPAWAPVNRRSSTARAA
jgi:membrane-associated phospholipid phosphatase